MVVDAGNLIANKIRHVPRVLLGIHADNAVRFLHVRNQALIG